MKIPAGLSLATKLSLKPLCAAIKALCRTDLSNKSGSTAAAGRFGLATAVFCLPLTTLSANTFTAPLLAPATEDESQLTDQLQPSESQSPQAPYQLKIIKSGEARPVASNETAVGRAKNRRVDIRVVAKVPEAVEAESSAYLPGGGSVWVTRDPVALNRLLRINASSALMLAGGEIKQPLEFKVETNYSHFIARTEILIYRQGDEQADTPLSTIPVDISAGEQRVLWDGGLDEGQSIDLASEYELSYALRVYDEKGSYDQTQQFSLRVKDALFSASDSLDTPSGAGQDSSEKSADSGLIPGSGIIDTEAGLSVAPLENTNSFEDVNGAGIEPGYDELAVQNIVIQGARVRVHGQDLGTLSGYKEQVTVNGDSFAVTEDGFFVAEYLMPSGSHEFLVASEGDREGVANFQQELLATIEPNYFFMVGLADLTVGQNDVSGSIEPLAVDPHHYDGDIFVDGRLAFYLKGKIKGKYLITAQLDTGTEDVSDLFDDFHRKDPRSVFRRLDPDQYYLVYGDDSNVYDDTDSQGKFYLRVEWDKSNALWGNFNTAFSGTELAAFNRSLYGARVQYQSLDNTALGDSKTEVSAFASEAQTAFRHNEFIGTGGSLYYLRDKDIVLGSEKVWVEVRQSGGERVYERIPLIPGRDYEIDEFQGRIILTRPLHGTSIQSGPSIIRDTPVDGSQSILVVDYEYIPDDFDPGRLTAGVRAKRWLGDHLAVGATWAQDEREEDDYSVKAADLTFKKSDSTYLRAEIAQSESTQTSGSFLSDDGGISFTAFNSNAGASSGNAYSIEGRLGLKDMRLRSTHESNKTTHGVGDVTDAIGNDKKSGTTNKTSGESEFDLTLGAWYKYRDADFSVSSLDSGADTVDTGLEWIAQLNNQISLEARATLLERAGISRESTAALQGAYQYTDQLALSAEIKELREENLSTGGEGEATLAAGKVSYKLSDLLSVYSIAQATLRRSGEYEKNNQWTLGAQYELSDKLSTRAELSSGDRGDAIVAGTEWRASESYSVYSNLSYELLNQGLTRRTTTFGQRKQISKRLKIYTEHQFSHDDERLGASHTLGFDRSFKRFITANLSLQSGSFEDSQGETTDRNAVSVGLDVRGDTFKAGSRFEYRRDKGTTLDLDHFVTTNRFEYQRNPGLRWQGKFNASVTKDRLAQLEDARFVEAGLGFALRPISHDRLNMLGRLTYLYDLPPVSQSNQADSRSLIGSLEGVLSVNAAWSLGGKIAHREGELRLLRDEGEWFGNDASLVGLRVHYRVPFGLEVLGSWRWLNSEATEGMRQGALFSISGAVDQHLNLSLGYNFTDFDDDLGNDSYDVRGWFFNLVGHY